MDLLIFKPLPIQFRNQSTLTGVAQAVIDRIARIHHDVFMSNNLSREIEDSLPAGNITSLFHSNFSFLLA